MITEGITCKTFKDCEEIEMKDKQNLRKDFPHLKESCSEHVWAPSCFHCSIGIGWVL